MKVAVVGATGLVGRTIIDLLDRIQVDELLPVASQRSVGSQIQFQDKDHLIISMEDALKAKPHIAIFSAGSSVSKEFAPQFAEGGSYVIDNSSAWRMDADKKLIVPEINGHTLTKNDRIIANPNCSTIQLVMALAPLHETFTITRILVSTYQSVTGSGYKAVNQLVGERKGEQVERAYPHEIDLNCIPHCDDFEENGYTKEEMKLVNETRKILDNGNLQISATAVRVPVVGGHSESVNVTFRDAFDIARIIDILSNTPGITLKDDPLKNEYPTPQFAKDKNDVFVGRIRQDLSAENAVNMWVVADNLRKGAATNALQIAALMQEKMI